jgi:predicted Asp-tRNA(Asn)/Glu-tRNA(Gln) amidotransferase subunit C
MDREAGIQKDAEKVLKELSETLGEIDLPETYYVVEDINVTRQDGEPTLDEEFKEIIRKNAPRVDEEGNFIMEVGKWIK